MIWQIMFFAGLAAFAFWPLVDYGIHEDAHRDVAVSETCIVLGLLWLWGWGSAAVIVNAVLG